MSYLDAYRERVSPNGASMKDAIQNTSKRQAINYIMDSPTLTHIRLNNSPETTPVIASDKETFHKRLYLFLPDTVINVGDYIHQLDGSIYLATNQDKDEIYPQLFGDFCNSQFPSSTVISKVLIGHDPRTGRPLYEEEEIDVLMPCVSEYQSFMSNDGSFLTPEGRLKIVVRYEDTINLELNREFFMYGTKFKIASVDLTKVIDGIGVVTVISEVVQ